MILGESYRYWRPEAWRDTLPMTPEGCDFHLQRLVACRASLQEAIATMDQQIADLNASLATERANLTSMWTGIFTTRRNTTTKPMLIRVLNERVPGRFTLCEAGRGVWRVIFKDKESATIAKMFNVTLTSEGHLSLIGATVFGPFPWDER